MINLIRGLLAIGCTCALGAQAAVHTFEFNGGFQNGGNVPDGGGAIGWSDMRTLSGISDHSITDVSVTLNVSGGYNGDLYAYLSYNNVLVSLLNRVGVDSTGPASGYADSGFNIRLSDTGALGDIHRYQQVSGYQARISDGSSWQPDGRTIPPNVVPQSFDGAERIGFNSYQNMDPNGTWTLFISDWSGGDSSLSQVVSWGLEITAVPEPIDIALGMFGALFALVSGWRWVRVRRPFRSRLSLF